jgi:hypothetical protein
MAQAKEMLAGLKRYAEGGEVTEEFPEEAGVMPGQNPSEAAKRLLYYKKTAAPPRALSTDQPDGMYQEPTVASETARVFGMKPREDRGNILPIYKPATGLVAPGWMYDIARNATAADMARKGYAVAPEEGVSMALNFTGAGLGVSTAMKKPTGTGGKDISMSTLPSGSTAKDDLAKVPKKLAPANESGFYSPTEAAALNLQRKSGSGQAFLNDLMKGENVRPDEIKAMGLDTFLKDKKNVTTAEVQDFIAKNKIQLGEARYGGVMYEDPVGIANREKVFNSYEPEIQRLYKAIDNAKDFDEQGRLENRLNDLFLERDKAADAVYKIEEAKESKFSSYALPGGENYREIVLTLPEKSSAYTLPPGASVEKTPSGKFRVTYKDGSSSLFMDENKLSQSFGGEDLTYKSSHWDEPNPLSHLRVSDRVTDGKKTLLVDEVQSDWHQAGRERGYAGELPKNWSVDEDDLLGWVVRNEDGEAIGSGSTKQEALDASTQGSSGRVPDAPYKDDWYQLTLRRAIKEAVDGGYDRIALPTGARVAERFDLSKQIESISHQKNPNGTYQIVAIDKNNRHVMNETSVSAEKLSNIVGKDIAKKIIGEEGTPFPEQSVGAGMKKLSGLDLQVGGEGMKKYYDEIYPGYLKKFGKKYGAEVGKTTTPTDYARDAQGVPSMYPKEEPLFYMEITPKMREEFSTGIPMKRGGEVLKGGIGSIPTK